MLVGSNVYDDGYYGYYYYSYYPDSNCSSVVDVSCGDAPTTNPRTPTPLPTPHYPYDDNYYNFTSSYDYSNSYSFDFGSSYDYSYSKCSIATNGCSGAYVKAMDSCKCISLEEFTIIVFFFFFLRLFDGLMLLLLMFTWILC